MAEELSREEVAILIRARRLLRRKGLPKDADVTAICGEAGISRKTGYEWMRKYAPVSFLEKERALEAEVGRLRAGNEELEKRCDDLRFENEGRKLAWEIHGVDEYLASKKNTMRRSRSGKR